MKTLIHQMMRKCGFDIHRYVPDRDAASAPEPVPAPRPIPAPEPQPEPVSPISTRTDRVSFFVTKTGKYYLPSDALADVIANAIKADQIFEEDIYATAMAFIKPGTTVLDVGSNFGQMAVLFSKLVGAEGLVHAFEADDFVYSILEKNIKENSDNIVPHFGAVHKNNTEILYFPIQDFKRWGSYGSYGIDYVQKQGRPVQTLTIDQIAYEKPVSFMKIDTQGGDLMVMEGAVRTIEKYRMPILFEYEYAYEQEQNLCFQNYVDFVRSIDYKFSKVILGQNYLILPQEQGKL